MQRLLYKNIYLLILLPALGFLSCGSVKEPDNINSDEYISKGDSIVKITFDTLRNTLTRTIGEKGVMGAVDFCKTNARWLTETYNAEGIQVKRVAERFRNPENKPDSTDIKQWVLYTEKKSRGDSLTPGIISKDGMVYYYKPILLQPMCLACHGEAGKDMSPAMVSHIDSLYPGDLAKGFKPGDLRGMWKITFSK